MKQRATIARTLAPDPKVVLFDEPFSALDALTREKMQEHIRSIWKKSRKCFLFITHDVDEALLLSRRLLIMKAGPGRIHADYPNPLTRKGTPYSAWDIKNAESYKEVRDDIISMIQSEEDLTYSPCLKTEDSGINEPCTPKSVLLVLLRWPMPQPFFSFRSYADWRLLLPYSICKKIIQIYKLKSKKTKLNCALYPHD